MVAETKQKNWFRRHWIISIFLGLIVLGFINGVIEGIIGENNPQITGNVVNEQTTNPVQEEIKQTQSEEELIQETRGESRSNPLAINTPISFIMEYGWWQEAKIELTITEVKRGGSAWNMIKEANYFNDEPAQNKEYLLTKIKIKVLETEDDEPYSAGYSDFALVSSNGVVYENPSVVEPEPSLDREVYAGGTLEGWEAFEVDKSDKTPLLRVEGANEKILWIKLDASSDNENPIEEDSEVENIYFEEESSEVDVESESSTETSDWLEEFEQAIKDLEETSKINDKLDECTELCAGEDIDILYVEHVCHSGCAQVYYYSGEEALDKYIEELKG